VVQVYETTLDAAVSWFPVVSLKALKEEVRLLQQSPWRSIRAPVRDVFMSLALVVVVVLSNEPKSSGQRRVMSLASVVVVVLSNEPKVNVICCPYVPQSGAQNCKTAVFRLKLHFV